MKAFSIFLSFFLLFVSGSSLAQSSIDLKEELKKLTTALENLEVTVEKMKEVDPKTNKDMQKSKKAFTSFLESMSAESDPIEFKVYPDVMALINQGQSLSAAINKVLKGYNDKAQSVRTLSFVTGALNYPELNARVSEYYSGAQGGGTLELADCIAISAELKKGEQLEYLLSVYLGISVGDGFTVTSIADVVALTTALSTLAELSKPYNTTSQNALQLNWFSRCVELSGDTSILRSNKDADLFVFMPPDELRVVGKMTPGFLDRFRDALSSNKATKVVSFASVGGDLYEGVNAGYLIRENDLYTTLHGDCKSACAFAFVGGKKRWFDYDRYVIGFHDVAVSENILVSDREREALFERLAFYLDQMNVNADYVLDRVDTLSLDMKFEGKNALIQNGLISPIEDIACDASLASIAPGLFTETSRTSQLRNSDELQQSDLALLKHMQCVPFQGKIMEYLQDQNVDLAISEQEKNELCEEKINTLPSQMRAVYSAFFGCNP